MQAESKIALLSDPASGLRVIENPPKTKADEEGFLLDELSHGTVLEVVTRNHNYLVSNLGEGRALISGHPEYCPAPLAVDMLGSTWGDHAIRFRFISKGASMEFIHPERGLVRTSRILDVHEHKV